MAGEDPAGPRVGDAGKSVPVGMNRLPGDRTARRQLVIFVEVRVEADTAADLRRLAGQRDSAVGAGRRDGEGEEGDRCEKQRKNESRTDLLSALPRFHIDK